MPVLFSAAVTLVALGFASSQGPTASPASPPSVETTATVEDRFRALAGSTRLTDPTLKPWHLRLSFTQKANGDHPADAGIIEEWWADRDHYRITLTSDLYAGTTTRNGTVIARTNGVDRLPAIDADLLRIFTGPLPSETRIGKFPPTLIKRSAGKAELDCFVLGFQSKRQANIPFGTLPTFCSFPGSSGLNVVYRWQDETIVIGKQGKFQGQIIPTAAEFFEAGVSGMQARLDQLATFVPAPQEFAATPEQAVVNEVSSGLPYDLTPKLIKKAMPEYPRSMRERSVAGTIVLDALIGEDGRVESLSVLHSVDPELSRAAIAAIRQWQYTPETQNGRPVKVETDIVVNFDIGR